MINIIEIHKKAARQFEEVAKLHLETIKHYKAGNQTLAFLSTIKAFKLTALSNDTHEEILKYHNQLK
jgi:hypothetical protein